MKEFIIVCTEDKRFKENYKKTPTSESINHTEITNKLSGNDIYEAMPTSKIVKFFIISRINKAIKNKKIEKIHYRVDGIDMDVIESLNLIIHTYSQDIDLKIISHKEIDLSEVKKHFEKIKIL